MSIDPASLAITVALNAASMAMTMTKTIEGPRLTDLSATVADYGTPLNYFYGRRRLEAPCFYCEPIKEKKKKRKGKGGKYKEYTYYGTWASAIADHEIQQIDMIWFDRHLVYNQETGENIFEVSETYELEYFMRFYLGTEDQAADERMLATVEADEGVGTCPAYLGVAYIFFEDVPLEKIGNRFPQVSVMATANSDLTLPNQYRQQILSDISSGDKHAFSPNGKLLLIDDGANLTVISTKTRQIVSNVFYTGIYGAAEAIWALDNDGNVFAVGSDGRSLKKVAPDGTVTTLASVSLPSGFTNVYVFYVGLFGKLVLPSEGSISYLGTSFPYEENGLIKSHDFGEYVVSWFQDTYGSVWACCVDKVLAGGFDIDTVTFRRFRDLGGGGPDEVVVTGLPAVNSAAIGSCFFKSDDIERFVFTWAGPDIYAVDRFTGEIVANRELEDIEGQYLKSQMKDKLPSQKFLWTGRYTGSEGRHFVKISLLDFSILQWEDPEDWPDGVAAAVQTTWGCFYDRKARALVSFGYLGSSSPIYRFLSGDDTATTLGAICADVALRAGLTEDDFDFSDLDQIVYGYSWTQGDGRGIVSHLLEIYDSEIRPHDFQLQGLKRGSAITGPDIETEWLVRDGDSPLYTVRAIGDTDLPRRIFGIFADVDADQEANSATAQRNAASVATLRETTYDVTTLALTADEAQTLIERRLRREWMASVKPTALATPKELDLEPGDVRNLNLDGETLRCSLRAMTIRADRVIEMQWERDDAATAVAISAAGAPASGRPPSEVYIPVATQGFVLDIPLITDAHDQTTPFLYLAAGPAVTGIWPGADVHHSDSGTSESFESGWDGFGANEEATWGSIEGVLNAAPTDVIDEGSEITVTLPAGTLESVTDEYLAANADANLALIGREIVQFRDAVLQSGGQYVLSGFVRGCRGTEQYADSHVAGERFLLLDSFVKRHDVGASEIGDTDYYKVETASFALTTTETITVAFAAVANKPYSPVNVELTKEDDGDWTITWQRRSRIGGATLNGQDVPLGETSEAYKVRILDGFSGATLRTIETTSESATYSLAEQTTDWGGEQTILTVEVVQMSPTLGIEGFPTVATA